MIPARDGVRLHTKIFTPKNQTGPLPIILRRTPYGIEGAAGSFDALLQGAGGRRLHLRVPGHPRQVRVRRHVRDAAARARAGRHHQPGRGHRHLRHHRVAAEERAATTTAASACSACRYDGWTTIMAALEPHPALKAISPQASPADMWLGDDFHHNGAFRLSYGFEYAAMMETGQATCSSSRSIATTPSTGTSTSARWPTSIANYLREQDPDLERLRRASRLRRVLEAADDGAAPDGREGADAERRRLVGPGGLLRAGPHLRGAGAARHGGHELPRGRPVEPRRLDRGTGDALGPIAFGSDTAAYFRDEVQAPFFAYFLKDKGTRNFPEALTFEAGSNQWRRWDAVAAEAGHADRRPVRSAAASGCASTPIAGLAPAAGADARARIRRVRLRPGASRAVPAAPDSADLLPRRLEVVHVAGRGPALRRRPRRRPQLGDAARSTEDVTHRRRGDGAPLRVDDRHATPTGS